MNPTRQLFLIFVVILTLQSLPFLLGYRFIPCKIDRVPYQDGFTIFLRPTSAAGRGFGKPAKGQPPTENFVDNDSADTTVSEVSPLGAISEGESAHSRIGKLGDTNASTDELIKSTSMFKSARLRDEAKLAEKIEKLKEQQMLAASDPSVGAVPELVADRMIRRIALFLGIPLFGGLSIFVAAFFASKKYDVTIPPMMIAYATQVPFVVGLLGISYAIISTSWDEEEGSALGLKEFKLNLSRIKDGMARTKDTERLKSEIERESDRLGR